mgnify:CR=1 FL=1
MAKKFAKINGLFNVFVLKTDNNTQYYDPAKIIKDVVDIDKNTICFASATAGDVDKKIGEYTIKENDRFIITQGGIYAYTGKQYSEPVIPDTPDTPIEDTWRPIYINSTPINELEYTKNNEYGDTVTVKPIKPALDFTTPKTTYEVNGTEYAILKIDDSYDDIYDIVSMEFGVDYNELKRFIEAVLPSKETIGNGNLAINVNGTNAVNFTANQTTDSEINFVNGDNIEITTEDDNSIKISCNEKRIYTTEDIKFAKDIIIGGTTIGDIIAADNIFPDDKITTNMTLQEVFEAILSGTKTMEEWGNQKVLAELIPSKNTKIKLTANVYYSNGEIGDEIDLNQSVINLEAGTMILVTYETEDPVVYQNVTVGPFIGGFALDNTSTQVLPIEEPTEKPTEKPSQYIEYKGQKEYKKTFDGTTVEFYKHTTDWTGFSKENVTGINENQIVLKVAKGENEFSVNQGWYIKPNLVFDQYNVYPISNRGEIGTTDGLYKIIDYKLFTDLSNTGTLSSDLYINGIAKDLLPYYIGIVDKSGKPFDFVEGQEINSKTLLSNAENGIRIEKYNTEAPREITPTTYSNDLQLFIAVPVNQFSSTDWLISVVNIPTGENITELNSLDFSTNKISATIDGKPYYLWILSGIDYSTFGADMYKITLNK